MAPPPPPPLPPPLSSEIIGQNDDILSEILLHLPVKSLLQFKTVSKQWNSLISDRGFSILHCRRHCYSPSSGLFFLHHHPFISPIYDFISFTSSSHPPFFSLLKSSSFDINQSCNGLFLCSSDTDVVVCNPTTNAIASIEALGKIHPRCVGINLCFDPLRSPFYEIVHVYMSNFDESLYSLDVYDSKTKKWRNQVVDQFRVPFDVEFLNGVYWERGIYWLSHTESTIFFDLETESVESLILPKALEGAYIERFRYFGESCGHLHLIEIRTNCVQEFDVLELNKIDKIQWLVKYRVNLDVLGRGFESEMFLDHTDRFGRKFRFYAFSIFAIVRDKVRNDEDEKNSEMVLSIPGKVIAYNFKTKISRLICNVVDESDKLFPFRGHNAVQFIESLYSP
ncbi:unnamed protein product [Amaranthus hypochondriacus]